MKLLTNLLHLAGIAIALAALAVYKYQPKENQEININQEINLSRQIEYSDLLVCRELNKIWKESMPLRHIGSSLTVSNHENITLCPGDSFGDLNSTYVVVKNCDIEMYHKDRLIWSSMMDSRFQHPKKNGFQPNEDCAVFLTKGNIELLSGLKYPPQGTYVYNGCKGLYLWWRIWGSSNSLKTEFRVQDQQFQIHQTLIDGTQKLFSANETHPQLREYLGGPKKIGSSGFVKSHTDNDTTILKKNEYLGDLDGLNLILQTDCMLHLMNTNHTIWFFHLPQAGIRDICSLVVEEEKWISGSSVRGESLKPAQSRKNIDYEALMTKHSFKVLESQFVLKDDQLSIIQTLEDGSKLTFDSQPDNYIGLKLRKEPRQIAQNPLIVTRNETPFIIERMDYVGDLNGLHLILQDNCTWMLLNGQEKLWQQQDPYPSPCMECFITLFSNHSSPVLKRIFFSYGGASLHYFGVSENLRSGQVILENDHAIIILDGESSSSHYYAGPNTQGDWSKYLPERSLIRNAKDHRDLNIPKYSHLGNIYGVYARFERDCNWVLYNRSQILWESGTSQSIIPLACSLDLKKDGTLDITYKKSVVFDEDDSDYTDDEIYERGSYWSTINTTKNADPSKKLLTSELSIENDWLWLTNTFKDGTVQKFKALEGTNNFTKVAIELMLADKF